MVKFFVFSRKSASTPFGFAQGKSLGERIAHAQEQRLDFTRRTSILFVSLTERIGINYLI
jgi:hypothetical protein